MRTVLTPLTFPPQGRPGIDADAAPGRDYGSVRYGEMSGLAPTSMAPFTEMPFIVTQPRTVDDRLRAPFAGHVFLDQDGILRARAAGDSYLLSVRMSATPSVIGGWIELNVYVANNISGLAGAISTVRFDLSNQAGVEDRPNLMMQLFPSSGFLANGAMVRMRSSVPVQVANEVIFITPLVAAP